MQQPKTTNDGRPILHCFYGLPAHVYSLLYGSTPICIGWWSGTIPELGSSSSITRRRRLLRIRRLLESPPCYFGSFTRPSRVSDPPVVFPGTAQASGRRLGGRWLTGGYIPQQPRSQAGAAASAQQRKEGGEKVRSWLAATATRGRPGEGRARATLSLQVNACMSGRLAGRRRRGSI